MEWLYVCDITDINEDEPQSAEVDGTKVGVFQVGDSYFAIENVCPHAYALLTDGFIEDDTVECPLHEAIFEIRTGKTLSGPVDRDLCTFPLKVEDNKIYIQQK